MSTAHVRTGPLGSHARRTDALRAERHRIELVLTELADLELDQHTEAEAVGEVGGAAQHPADVASETLEREVELGLLVDFRAALAEVEAAEGRLADGTYGTCERCRQPIGEARLAAVPATRWCLNCAAAVEHDQRWRTLGTAAARTRVDVSRGWPDGGTGS